MAGTKKLMIAGEAFEVQCPFDAGYVLTEADARHLNQVRAENIGNNMRAAVKEHKEKGTLDQAQREVAEYDQKYTFAMPGVGRVVRDPVEREARSIAREQLKLYLAQQGRKLKDADPEKLEARIEEISQREEVLKEARTRVKQKQKFASTALEGLDV